jgi:Lar family restriction alleviation protein
MRESVPLNIYRVLSCPFCGAFSHGVEFDEKGHSKIICGGCGAMGGAGDGIKEAVEMWNQRV